MFEQWIEVLSGDELNLTAPEIADICWLALIQYRFGVEQLQSLTPPPGSSPLKPRSVSSARSAAPPDAPNLPPKESAGLPTQATGGLFTRETSSEPSPDSKPLRVPTAPALRSPLSLTKSLRPLMQKRSVGQGFQLDEPATVHKIAEERIWRAITKPMSENWLELALVVDESASMLIWRRTIQELNRFFKHYGVFRDVRLWGLISRDSPGRKKVLVSKGESSSGGFTADLAGPTQSEVFLRANPFFRLQLQDLRRPHSLIDSAGRRLILIVTDCVDPIWQTPQLLSTLKLWGECSPMAILQMMPEWLWTRTNLRQATLVNFQGKIAGGANQVLDVVLASAAYRRKSKAQKKADIKVPIITLESDRIHVWTQMVAAQGPHQAPGVIFNPRAQAMTVSAQQRRQQKSSAAATASIKVQTFRGSASPRARRLASLLAASPDITLPIIRMVQETLLPQSEQVHVAEVLLGGILQPQSPPSLDANPDDVRYEFVDPEIRSVLLPEAPISDTTEVLSKYIRKKFNQSPHEFILELRRLMRSGALDQDKRKPIATVAAEVLQYRGAEYVDFIREVRDRYGPLAPSHDESEPLSYPLPRLEPFEFIEAWFIDESEQTFPPSLQSEECTIITFQSTQAPDSGRELESFEFTVATLVRNDGQWNIQRQQQRAYRYIERIPGDIPLEIVSIPGGTFLMGSPEDEPERYHSESPQHEVTVAPFFMGRYPVTWVQWRPVVGLPQVERELASDPSHFRQYYGPVEVSWYEAVEFCQRLSRKTGRAYRLPTEAEWEYACRAGTISPFHFGETISSRLANYRGTTRYADGPEGEYRGEITPVEMFKIANAFGLSDMHGNVLEWCQDLWHRSYQGAPSDGTAWLSFGNGNYRVYRGGSCDDFPRYCRSAYRDSTYAFNSSRFGFRVCCSALTSLL